MENERFAIETIGVNRPSLPVVGRDIASVPTAEIMEAAGLAVGDLDVLIGAPPCEPFSTAGRRNGFLDSRALAVYEFIRVVNEAKPQFFVVEEVPGFTRAAKRHISFYERMKTRPQDLDPDLRPGSAFDEIMAEFEDTGYNLNPGILNARRLWYASEEKKVHSDWL